MDDDKSFERLIEFGLTRSEAQIYLCLLERKELTGYEVSKETGIARSNVYGSFSGLVAKGAVYVMDGTPAKYLAVDIAEFCDNRIRLLTIEKERLISDFSAKIPIEVGYITIEGYKHIEDRIITMIQGVTERLYFSAESRILSKFAGELEKKAKEGKKIVLITEKEMLAKSCTIYIGKKQGNQVRLITDSNYVLTGEFGESTMNTCLYAGHKNFVNVFKEALGNEIKLIQLEEKTK